MTFNPNCTGTLNFRTSKWDSFVDCRVYLASGCMLVMSLIAV